MDTDVCHITRCLNRSPAIHVPAGFKPWDSNFRAVQWRTPLRLCLQTYLESSCSIGLLVYEQYVSITAFIIMQNSVVVIWFHWKRSGFFCTNTSTAGRLNTSLLNPWANETLLDRQAVLIKRHKSNTLLK